MAIAHSANDRLVLAYARSSHWRQRALSAANAAFDGFWLGVLDGEDLSRLDETYYDTATLEVEGEARGYVDEAWVLHGLEPWEAAAIDSHFPDTGRVVVTGAGGGREVLALLERGYDAVGFEPHPVFVAGGADLLERQGHPQRLHLSGRDGFPSGVARCDAILVGWGSYMLIPSRRRRVDFLREAREHLAPGAPLLLSFFVRPEGRRYLHAVATTANAVRRLRRSEPVELGDALSPNYVHYFTQEEIAAELAAAGFRMVAFESEPYGHAVARAD